jgi:transcription factor C subunit 6
MPLPRRSGRASLPNKNYSNDVPAEIRALFSSDSESDPAEESEETEDDEFDEQDAVAAAEDEQDLEEDESVIGAGHSSASESVGNADADFGDDIVDFSMPSSRKVKRQKIDAFRNSGLPSFNRRGADLAQSATHSRGLTESHHGDSREKQILYSIGPGTEDLAAYIRTRDKWGNQGPLPSRKASLTKDGKGGLAYSFYYLEKKRKKEADKGWEWYYENEGHSVFKRDQKIVEISFNDIRNFSPLINYRCNLIYGPTRNQKYYNLEAFHALRLKDCWNEKPHYQNLSKEGFIIPVDGKVQCLEWIPNQNALVQYLCTVAQRTSFQDANKFTNDVNSIQEAKAVASPPYRSCMQIWELKSISQRNSFAPYLRANIAWDWGELKRMQWCPVPVPNSPPDLEEQQVYLGLMAGIWADGFIRVLDLSLTENHDHKQECLCITQAAFESRPPGTTCTNLTWLSSSSIAASCANGFVAIWDLSSILIPRLKYPPHFPASNPRPWFYHCLHQSYILNITSGYPSRPHIIFTSSMDGHTRLTDIRNPIQDFAPTQRQRVSLPPLSWHDHSQSIITTDDNLLLKKTPLRRIYSSTSFARCDALVTDIAASLIHPIILAGCADGRVWGVNPLKRPKSGKAESWQICWFGHEWRRGLSSLDARTCQQEQPSTKGDAFPNDGEGVHDPDAMDLDADTSAGATKKKTMEEILREPLCRIVDGYKMIKAGAGSSEERAKGRNSASTTIAVHEQLTAITKVAWNPNLRFGTWAAAATASGIVRIEDIAAEPDKGRK